MARQALRASINGLPVTIEADVTAELGPTGAVHTLITFEDGTPHLGNGDTFTITTPVEVAQLADVSSPSPRTPPSLYIAVDEESAEHEYRATLAALRGGQIPHTTDAPLRRIAVEGAVWQWMTPSQVDQRLHGMTIIGWHVGRAVQLSATTTALLELAAGRWPERADTSDQGVTGH